MNHSFGDVPVNPIKLSVVNRCAKSATTLPRPTTLSNVLSFPIFARLAASRNRATFSCGVSFGGAGPPMGIIVARGGAGFAAAYGPVDVKSVGSFAIMYTRGPAID
jgi:hypothetical protein